MSEPHRDPLRDRAVDEAYRRELDSPAVRDDWYVDEFGYELECTHCNGDGTCDVNADPLWDCDDQPHPCHACGGTGKRRDQTIF